MSLKGQRKKMYFWPRIVPILNITKKNHSLEIFTPTPSQTKKSLSDNCVYNRKHNYFLLWPFSSKYISADKNDIWVHNNILPRNLKQAFWSCYLYSVSKVKNCDTVPLSETILMKMALEILQYSAIWPEYNPFARKESEFYTEIKF